MHTIHGTKKLCAHQSKSFYAIAFNVTEPSAKTNTEILNKTILIKKYISNKS